MMTIAQKMVAVSMILLIVLAMFLFSPLLGILALVGSAPLGVAILRL